MDYEINLSTTGDNTLSQADQDAWVSYIHEAHKKGKSARNKYESDWNDCMRAYNCEHDPIVDSSMDWRSRAYLPWSYDAVESAYAFLHNAMLPRDEDIFVIDGRTTDDDKSCKIMETYLKYVFDRNGLSEQFGALLKQILTRNHTCAKVYWREDVKVVSEWQQQPIYGPVQHPETGETMLHPDTGEPLQTQVDSQQVRTQREQTTFNSVWFEAVDLDNFVFWPIHGDINKSTRIHETSRYLDELQEAAERQQVPYFNLEKITANDERDSGMYSSNTTSMPVDTRDQEKRRGLNIKEAWVYRAKINGKVYKNKLVAVANDQWVIRCQDMPYDLGMSAFTFTSLIPDRDCNYGFGLLSKTVTIQRSGNFTFNALLDETKLKIYRSYKWWNDETFDPYSFVSRPGALIEFANAESCQTNLIPVLDDFGNLNLGYQELTLLQDTFENSTVPKVVKGMLEQGTGTTATEINWAQTNAGGRMHIMAQRINEKVLKPILELAYLLIQQRAQYDPRVLQDIARVTMPSRVTVDKDPMTGQPLPQPQEIELTPEQMVAQLPKFLPLPEIDIKVVGYQNSIMKQQQLANIEKVVTALAQSPASPYLVWHQIAEDSIKLSDLPADKYVMNEEQRKQVDQQSQQRQQTQDQMMLQQAQAQIADVQAKAQAESDKTQIEYQKEQNRLVIEMAKLEIERQRLAQDHEIALKSVNQKGNSNA